MRLAGLPVAVLLAGCASTAPGRPESIRGHEVLATIEVHLLTDPYTPRGRFLPLLHEVAWRTCGRRYEIVDRQQKPSYESILAYQPKLGMVAPAVVPSYEIVALIKCLRR